MCKKSSLLTRPMSSKMYSTWERSQAHETLTDCRNCSNAVRVRCQKSFSRTNKPTESNLLPDKYLKFKNRLDKPELPRGQILRKHGFKVEISEKQVNGRTQFKVIPIIYGRTRDRYKEMIHE